MCEYPISRNCKKLETFPTLGFIAFMYFFLSLLHKQSLFMWDCNLIYKNPVTQYVAPSWLKVLHDLKAKRCV